MEVENGSPKWKETNIGETHFLLDWLWEEGRRLDLGLYGYMTVYRCEASMHVYVHKHAVFNDRTY